MIYDAIHNDDPDMTQASWKSVYIFFVEICSVNVLEFD